MECRGKFLRPQQADERRVAVLDLESMSFAELGKLFPIIICDYDPLWPALYLSEKALIEKAAGPHNIVRISHYGSTSVPGLSAKPTIDILLEVKEDIDRDILIWSLKEAGYRFSPQPGNPPPHMMFMKGYTPEGFRGQAYHVHVRYGGDWRELHFRDYLCSHPDIAAEYGLLKRELKKKYEHDREAYTNGKGEFIDRITCRAQSGRDDHRGTAAGRHRDETATGAPPDSDAL